MRIFTEEQRRKKLRHAYKRTVETGKDHVGTAIKLMSPERQQEHWSSLENDTSSKEGIARIMDEVARDVSGGRFETWMEVEQSLGPTTSNYLRLFNLGATLEGSRQLIETSEIMKRVQPYLDMLRDLYGPDVSVKFKLERSPD